MKVNICADPALVTSACLRIRTRRFELHAWWARGPRVAVCRAEP